MSKLLSRLVVHVFHIVFVSVFVRLTGEQDDSLQPSESVSECAMARRAGDAPFDMQIKLLLIGDSG
jgi:hypothetical protein